MAIQETGQMQIIFYFIYRTHWVRAQVLSRLFGKLGETEREDSKVPYL